MNTALGNIVANVIATGAGAAVGGGAGAFGAYNVDRFNRQLHPEEVTLAKQIADKSGGKYTQAQVEDQLRIMGVSVKGASESGAPTTLIGQTPTDSGAQWISAGTTADGKPILTQVTAQADPQLQSYILANYNGASPGQVPSQFSYALTGNSGSTNVTGPFTKFDQSDVDFMRNTTADAASMVSTNAGRVGSAAAAGSIPSPYTVAFESIAFGSTTTGWVADFVAQLARPNPGSYVTGSIIDLALGGVANKYPLVGPVITEFGTQVKDTGPVKQAGDKLNDAVRPKK
jgi:filamentous hemagglutinin